MGFSLTHVIFGRKPGIKKIDHILKMTAMKIEKKSD